MTTFTQLPAVPAVSKPSLGAFRKLLLWSVLPMVLWYTAANGLAYYFTRKNEWMEFRHEAVVFYAFLTLYAVPFFLTVVTGFMVWGYALRMYCPGRGTLCALGLFIVQWLTVWALIQASIHWHYVYFYTEQVYS